MIGNVALAVVCPVMVFWGWVFWRLGSGLWAVSKAERQPVQVTRVVRRWDYERVRRVENN